MGFKKLHIFYQINIVSAIFISALFIAILTGLLFGSTSIDIKNFLTGSFIESAQYSIVWKIRLPRVIMAALVGAALSLGGLVFQVLLRNPLAEPYILGISGGSAIGAIIGMMIGLSVFPGVSFLSFSGSMIVLLAVLFTSGKNFSEKNSLILSGVIINAFCSAIIMFLIYIVESSKIHNILFWLMGNLSMVDIKEIKTLVFVLLPCFIVLFFYSHTMNILLMGNQTAKSIGVNVQLTVIILFIITSFMVSMTVCYAGIIGFTGLVIPHLLRFVIGSDNRLLVPASIFGGGAYMVFCDLLSRVLPKHGEMPVGVITALIGAPLFIILLKKTKI